MLGGGHSLSQPWWRRWLGLLVYSEGLVLLWRWKVGYVVVTLVYEEVYVLCCVVILFIGDEKCLKVLYCNVVFLAL